MNDTISLVESKTFWSSTLGLVALIASQFHIPWLASWATDPQTIPFILQLIAGVSFLATMYFRKIATAQVAGVVSSVPTPGAEAKGNPFENTGVAGPIGSLPTKEK